jgi:hypothetical protein
MGGLHILSLAQRPIGVRMEVGGLKSLHVCETVDDSAADLEEPGPATLPTPLL